ncbi:alpha/beta fold hydrolase [Streptomyces olivaceus]|uniref:alpha/beta fold hydrolase n=1 Tax=Streptomyces olivaceus TaxID=47716 RepID=UPI001CCA8F0F|nr:alpha/beta fold hydrolase [Streptomyces olivaceus]MBZ6256186.1 alpha/beta fold hydrolase [Streptomyces olivaceus]
MPFTVTDVPDLPARFTDTFTSHTVRTSELNLHAVVGGDGPPMLLLPAWPQFWYQWRLVMPALAEHFTVVAADVRGTGASDKPATGYDGATVADDMAALMTSLGRDRFVVAGYDYGLLVGHALAAKHRDRVTRLAVGEAIVPGFSPSPPLLSDPATNEIVWHFAFNRLAAVNDRMVAGREEIYFGHQFASKAARPDSIPQSAVDVYVDALRDPAARHASFEIYRHIEETAEQFQRWRQEGPLAIPVLAIGGEHGLGTAPAEDMRKVASDVTGLVISGGGHFLAEEVPHELTKALLEFMH